MVYEIVLNNGTEIKCFGKSVDNILEMVLRHQIYIVKENNHHDKITYILPKDVSHFRFPSDKDGVAKPVI